MPLSLAIPRLPAREAIDAAAALMGSCAQPRVQLDAGVPGVRPRELDRSARRDLAAILKRHGCAASGFDLFIPPDHFASGEHADRAAAAALGAIDLLGELSALGAASGGVLCVELPESPRPEVVRAIVDRGQERGIRLADFGGRAGVLRGIDCAVALAARQDVAALLASGSVGAVRLSDWNGSRRVAVGSKGAKLDVEVVAGACAVAAPEAPVIIDTREAESDWKQWALAAVDAWTGHARV